ncbi:MAG TPA: transglutaminase family protein [Ktedonosporobacter sp.]|nr:transglutaminase family protein [Ktedonosporobacter sp.]
MGKKLAILLLTLTGLAGISGGYVVGGLQAYSRYQQTVGQQRCGGQKPVHVCVQAPAELFSAYYPFDLSAHTSLFTVTYNSSSPLTLLISVGIAGFTQVETHTVTASSAGQSSGFTPAPLDQAVRRQTSDLTTSLSVKVTDTHNNLYYLNDSPLVLHAHQLMQWVAANRLKIAAWVTPDDPAVTGLVSKAAALLPIQPAPAPTAMIGYLNHATPQTVRDQVDAIFDALRLDYHMRYLIENVPYSGPGDTSVALENIKLPSEVLQQHSGMCIELTALLASAVEKIGLHAEIVIIPGHAFLGVATTPDQKQFQYWDGVQVNNGVAGASANIYADQEYSANIKQIVDTILISTARQQGVGPMV